MGFPYVKFPRNSFIFFFASGPGAQITVYDYCSTATTLVLGWEDGVSNVYFPVLKLCLSRLWRSYNYDDMMGRALTWERLIFTLGGAWSMAQWYIHSYCTDWHASIVRLIGFPGGLMRVTTILGWFGLHTKLMGLTASIWIYDRSPHRSGEGQKEGNRALITPLTIGIDCTNNLRKIVIRVVCDAPPHGSYERKGHANFVFTRLFVYDEIVFLASGDRAKTCYFSWLFHVCRLLIQKKKNLLSPLYPWSNIPRRQTRSHDARIAAK